MFEIFSTLVKPNQEISSHFNPYCPPTSPYTFQISKMENLLCDCEILPPLSKTFGNWKLSEGFFYRQTKIGDCRATFVTEKLHQF